MASDNLNENFTTVVIHVKDVNDNPPIFDRPTYETQITEEDDRSLPKQTLKVITLAQPLPQACSTLIGAENSLFPFLKLQPGRFLHLCPLSCVLNIVMTTLTYVFSFHSKTNFSLLPTMFIN